MKRIFQNVKTGELIYFADDDSSEYKEFMKKRMKAKDDEYLEWFTFQNR